MHKQSIQILFVVSSLLLSAVAQSSERITFGSDGDWTTSLPNEASKICKLEGSDLVTLMKQAGFATISRATLPIEYRNHKLQKGDFVVATPISEPDERATQVYWVKAETGEVKMLAGNDDAFDQLWRQKITFFKALTRIISENKITPRC